MPLQLLIQSAAAGGVGVLDATPFVTACTISGNEHGPQELSATVQRALYDAFRIYDAPGTLDVSLNDGAQVLWAGRLEDPGIAAGAVNEIELHAYGYWRALSDVPYTALWSDTSLERWRVIETTEINNRTPDRYEVRYDNNAILIAPKKGETFGGNAGPAPLPAIASVLYTPPSGGSRQITLVQCDLAMDLPASWTFTLYRVNAALSVFNPIFTITSGGAALTRSLFYAITADDRLMLDLFQNTPATAALATDTGDKYCRLTNMRVCTDFSTIVNTTLTANRAAGAGVTATVVTTANMYAGMRLTIDSGAAVSESLVVTSVTNSTQFVATFVNGYVIGDTVGGSCVYADTIIKDLVAITNAANPTQILSSVTGIASPAKDITDAVYEDAYPQDIATDLASQGDAIGRTWEIGVDVFRRLWFRVRSSRAQAWYVDVSDISISRSLDGLRNSAYARYEDASGATIRSSATTNAASLQRYGITRRQAIEVQTTNATIAGLTRDVALTAAAQLQPRASLTLRTVYAASGARFPLAYVQAGDVLTIRNLPPAASATIDTIRTFRLTRVEYDAMANTLTVEPEAPNPTLDALIAGQV